jgi:RNA polymerase sigma-70 factor (ECF subfamily)
LLYRLRQRADHEAWTTFVELYTPLLHGWALRLGLPPAELEDFLQDLLAHLLTVLPDFRYDRSLSFRGWLWMVVRNRVLNRLRQRQPAGLTEADINGLVDGHPNGVEELTEAEYRQQLVGRALELMQRDFQPHVWKAFWECTVAERPAAEVAQELHMSLGAVYAAKFRVLTHLRQQLAGLLE